MTTSDGLLTTRQAAEWLNIPWETFRKKVAARQVPFTRVCGQIRFAPHHLDAIVAAGEQSVAKAPSRLQVVAIRAATQPTDPPRTPPPPTGPRTPPPPTGPRGPKKADGQQRESSAA